MKKLLAILVMLVLNSSISAQWNIYMPLDTITFEEIYPYLELDSSTQNIWQIGKPHKVFFDSAYASPHAIVTDTINNYPINNYSYFDLKIGEFNCGTGWFPYDVYIEIKHKYDTDTLRDGGYITVSYDDGLTWTNIVNDTNYYWNQTPMGGTSWNLYNSYNDSLSNGEWGFSGKSNGWEATNFGWHISPVKSNIYPDTMIVRFNFISDSIDNNKEGWMIDEIILYAIELGGAVHQLTTQEFKLYPNPVQQTAKIEFEKYYSDIEINVYNLQGQLIIQKNAPNSDNLILNCQELESGVYFLKIRSEGKEIGTQKLVVGH